MNEGQKAGVNNSDRMRRMQEWFAKRKAESDQRLYDCGFERGCEWAKVEGNSAGLQRLQRLRDNGDEQDWRRWFDWTRLEKRDRLLMFIAFANILHPDWQRSGNDVEAVLWADRLKSETGYNSKNPSFVRGFAEGVLSAAPRQESPPPGK